MALVVEKILSGQLAGMHDYVDTKVDAYVGMSFINDAVHKGVLERWLNGEFTGLYTGKASERDYETEVILILSPIEVTVGEGK